MDNNDLVRQFNLNAKEYIINKNDEHLNNILRSLQVLSVSLDSTVFDLTHPNVVEFFVNLHELMYLVDVNSSTMWAAVNVLIEACRNSYTREKLIHTYKFTAILTKLLKDDSKSKEKNIKVLQLLQELTYGMKIHWQGADLSKLISLLAKWIVGNEQDLVLPSLGVLINLCYKNIPAIYTLVRCVDIKIFVKSVLKLQRNNESLRVQVCKLFIILQDISGSAPDNEIYCYIQTTCPTLLEALNSGSICLMRHVVNFFKDIADNPKSRPVLMSYKSFPNDADSLLNSINDDSPVECIGILMDFLSCLVRLDCSKMENLYYRLLYLASSWLTTDSISNDSLNLISSVVSTLLAKEAEIPKKLMDVIEENITVILMFIVVRDSWELTNEAYNKLTTLLSLLSELLKVPKMAEIIVPTIDQNGLENLFSPLKKPTFKEANLFQEAVYTFYVQALYFLTELGEKETNWFLVYRELLRERKVQMVLSVALYTGPEHIKKRVLGFAGTTGFTGECVGILAGCLFELNKFMIFSPEREFDDHQCHSVSNISALYVTSIMTASQDESLNSLLEKYEKAAHKNQNVMVSSLMELYQFKIASLNQTMRYSQLNQEAADLKAIRLQHTLALTSSEVSRLHQLLLAAQQKLEANSLETDKLSTHVYDLETQLASLHSNYEQVVQTLNSKTRIISEQNTQLDNLKEEIRMVNEKAEEFLKDKVQLEESIIKCKRDNEIQEKRNSTLRKEINAQSDMISELKKLKFEKEIEIENLAKALDEEKKTKEKILEFLNPK